MRKEPGKYLIEFYDELGHKFNTVTASNVSDSQMIGDSWCLQNSQYSAVILRVISNTKVKK